MLNSSSKIRAKSSDEAIAKIREDYERVEARFEEFMTRRSMKNGIEVLDDLVSFFESSPAFISVACEKMRKTHGPSFKMATVKAILGLRTDLNKDERALAVKVCEEILDEFKKNPPSLLLKPGALKLKGATSGGKAGGIFGNLDTTQAEAADEEERKRAKA